LVIGRKNPARVLTKLKKNEGKKLRVKLHLSQWFCHIKKREFIKKLEKQLHLIFEREAQNISL